MDGDPSSRGFDASLMDDPQWALASQQAEKYDRTRRASLENTAEQQRQLKAEEELAKKDRSPFIPDIFYKPIHHPERIFENCAFKSAFGGVAGLGFGFMLGIFFASTAYDAQIIEGTGTTYQKVLDGFKSMGRQGISSAKNFGMVSVIFAGTECLIEKHRAKSDRYNGAYAGCITGAFFAARAGPKAAIGGCAGFAAFSVAIDWLLLSH
eukprot:Phypoly_transcript_21084.p1 GENE.Phypoly_transcript_21084~~Phypoly_transcript_21084.p1  ORF type:complete len:219 (+),score=26.94 Phypoly_transcript_21084:31-657(+)